MKPLEKLNDLVRSETPENIELAFTLCESQSINFDGLDSVRRYTSIIKWLSNYLEGYGDIKEGVLSVISMIILDLSSKNIKSLPESFGNLSMLRVLNLSNNKLEAIPNSIGKLQNLRVLDLRENKLMLLPASFKNLIKIDRIHLSKNKLRRIPKLNREDSKITWIDLVDNPIDINHHQNAQYLNELKKCCVHIFVD